MPPYGMRGCIQRGWHERSVRLAIEPLKAFAIHFDPQSYLFLFLFKHVGEVHGAHATRVTSSQSGEELLIDPSAHIIQSELNQHLEFGWLLHSIHMVANGVCSTKMVSKGMFSITSDNNPEEQFSWSKT